MLLRKLCAANAALLALNEKALAATGDAEKCRKEGESLYVDKPTLHNAETNVTWSIDEYGHAGLQHMYLRFKSMQRFCETWAMLERAAARGLFDDAFGRAKAAGEDCWFESFRYTIIIFSDLPYSSTTQGPR